MKSTTENIVMQRVELCNTKSYCLEMWSLFVVQSDSTISLTHTASSVKKIWVLKFYYNKCIEEPKYKVYYFCVATFFRRVIIHEESLILCAFRRSIATKYSTTCNSCSSWFVCMVMLRYRPAKNEKQFERKEQLLIEVLIKWYALFLLCKSVD